MFISVQEITQSGITNDQISKGTSVFVLYNLCTRLPIEIASLYISLFQGRKMT